MVGSGLKACKHAAAVLGLVTHAANNFEVATFDESGKQHTKRIRDAQLPTPAAKKHKESCPLPRQPPTLPPATAVTAGMADSPGSDDLGGHLQRHIAAINWRASGKEHAKRTRLADEARVRSRVADIATSLCSRPGKVSGGTRLAELKSRVAARADNQ